MFADDGDWEDYAEEDVMPKTTGPERHLTVGSKNANLKGLLNRLFA
jgi:hypothetical protein